MAYFLPSYFQKRLLRYALSRLDFIDSNALDLDNLGLTIGQRSVIELKSVGINVSKLVERLSLPSTITLRYASIRVLRVTIPADLHASGIEVEVDGIDIEVEVNGTKTYDDAERTSKRGGNVPSHKDIANRPRIASTAIHDPGGARSSSRRHDIETPQLLPAPKDLAASFLQAEPESEKQELQAAVQSTSVYLQQSHTSLDGSASEDGVGMPEGFSLPGFLTNFFTGIADRLSVAIKHIAVTISLLDADQATVEPLKLVLKVEELELQSLRTLTSEDVGLDARRHIRTIGVELLIVSDEDILAQKSSVSSPSLGKSRSTASTFSRHYRAVSSAHSPNAQSTARSPDSSSSSSAASSDIAQMGLGVHDSMLETSQTFGSSLSHSEHASSSGSPELSRPLPTRTQEDMLSTSPGYNNHSNSDDSLSQSMLFSHAGAESIYMSATSNSRSNVLKMPGGFGTFSDEGISSVSHVNSFDAIPPADPRATAVRGSSVTNPAAASQPRLGQQYSVAEDHDTQKGVLTAQQCIKRLLRINEATFKIPTRPQQDTRSDTPAEAKPRSRPMSSHDKSIVSNAPSMLTSSRVRMASNQSIYGIPKDQTVDLKALDSYEILIGDVEFLVDVALCHILLKSTTRLSRALKPESLPTTQPKKDSDLQLIGSIQSIVLNVMENVPEITSAIEQRLPTESTFSVRGGEAPLLQLQALKLHMQMALRDEKLDQKVSIHRLGLYREDDKIVSFFDPPALQESFVASSVVLEPDDVVLRQLDDRIDIAVKPMRITLDLLVLDDVLSRSGGLSSLLDLGNSVASTGTVKDVKSRTNPGSGRRRSVHFDEPGTKAQSDNNEGPGLKLNLRISGSIVELVGSQSSMQVKTSAIKLVYRKAKLRTSISSVSITGPLTRQVPASDVLSIKLGDVSFVYLETPEEQDLDRLLQLLVPSNDKYEQDDDIMVETLIRQRKKGGVARLSIQDIQLKAGGLAWTHNLSKLSEEISKLSTVTKYLPEDDRPGILTFILVSKLTARLDVDKAFGPLILKTNLLEGAHISVPSLMAAQISSITLSRGADQALIHELIPNLQENTILGLPMLMCRFIPDEMEPTIKLKLSNTCFEYSVPLLLAVTQLVESLQKDLSQDTKPLSPRASDISSNSSEGSDLGRRTRLSLVLRSSAISLKPLGSTACGLFLFTDAVVVNSSKRNTTLVSVEIKKASIMIIDDTTKIGREGSGADPKLYFDQNDQVLELVKSGFVPVGSISAASADVTVFEDKVKMQQFVDVEFRNNLLFLETCADSTQTLIQILGGLSPPAPPSKTEKFRTQIIPIEDMLASFTGHAFVSERGPDMGLQVEEPEVTPTPSTLLQPARQGDSTQVLDTDDEDESFMNDLYLSQVEDAEQDEVMEGSAMSQSSQSSMEGGSVLIAPVSITADDGATPAGSIMMHSSIDFRTSHFINETSVGGTAHRWDSTQNTYGMSSELKTQHSPLKVRVRDVHIIWNMFDGYDWQNTRDVITQAVRDVEDKAIAKQRRRESHRSPGPEEEDESVIGDVLFNSIYISIPNNRDPRELTNAINMELGDAASETGSYATSTTITAATSKRHSDPRHKPKKLRLNRSKQHKMTFELEGLAADFLAFPSGSGEVESSCDIRVRKLEVFDHIPTSTWKKFATYMHEAGEREVGTDMIHIELLNVKPVADLAASEMVLKITVLPLRLHVDQDALDFITRFFEFKDDRATPSSTPSAPPFLQRVEVNPIRLRLDFKPKRVDYAGLRSGRTTEFMNFFILDRADMVLRRVILYGVSGFDRLGIMLNNIWSPDVRNNQLPGVLAGLAPVRSLVDVGSGVRDLIAVPIREYKKDGRIVRSIQKGALAFAKTTTTELVNLGAKLAIGTQTVLQNAEGVLAPQNAQRTQSAYASLSDSSDDEQPHQISHYADQPLGIVQGLRGAYASLERDLLLAKDAIVAVPGEIMAEGSATGAAKVVLRQSPTIILRPAIGVTKAMGQAFLGAGNTLDKSNRRRIEDKYKRY